MRKSLHKPHTSKYLLTILALLLCLLFPALTTLTLNDTGTSHSSYPSSATEASATSVPASTTISAPAGRNTVVYSNEVFATMVNELLTNATVSTDAPLESFQIISRDDSGRVTALQIANQPIDIQIFTKQFNLVSAHFQVDEYNGGIRIITQ